MLRNSRGYRIGFSIAGLLAAIALAVRGFLDLRSGSGWALLIVAAMVVAAVALRWFVYRDQ